MYWERRCFERSFLIHPSSAPDYVCRVRGCWSLSRPWRPKAGFTRAVCQSIREPHRQPHTLTPERPSRATNQPKEGVYGAKAFSLWGESADHCTTVQLSSVLLDEQAQTTSYWQTFKSFRMKRSSSLILSRKPGYKSQTKSFLYLTVFFYCL